MEGDGGAMIDQWLLDCIVDPPWDVRDGVPTSVDGTPAAHFAETDVARVLAFGSSEGKEWRKHGHRPSWDGEECGVLVLKDGRFVAWETWWGPTGSGFSCDAYGGDAEILFGATKDVLVPLISEKARENMEWLP